MLFKTAVFFEMSVELFATTARSANLQALIYEGDRASSQGQVLFSMDRDEKREKEKLLSAESSYFSSDHQIVLKEELLLNADESLQSYVIDQKQLGQRWSLKRDGGLLTFSHASESTKKIEPWVENLVVGPTLVPYLRKKREELLAAGSVAIRFASLERKETIGFTLKKVKEGETEGEKWVLLEMRPESFFISLILNPIELQLEKQSFRLMRMKGRMLPKFKNKGKWLDFEGEMFFKSIHNGN